MNLFTAAETAANYANAGAAKAKLPISKMLVLGVLAGFLIGFPSCVTNMATYALDNNSTIRMISGLLFAFGLGMVVISGAELFTGNTLITISVLESHPGWDAPQLDLRVHRKLCWLHGPVLHLRPVRLALRRQRRPGRGLHADRREQDDHALPERLLHGHPVQHPGDHRRMFFVTCGFNHSIADMTYCMLGLFAKNVPSFVDLAQAAGVALDSLTWGQYIVGNLIPVTLGNIVGGAVVGFTFWFSFLRGAGRDKK